jgi:hypothetical protein
VTMEPSVKRDPSQASRKGRKPKHGTAMTAAERQRERRKRKSDKLKELPSWLRVRLKLWKLVQDEFMTENADEVCSALTALAAALTIANYYRASKSEKFPDWWFGLVAYCNPANIPENRKSIVSGLFAELKEYRSNGEGGPLFKDAKIFDLLSDILEPSRNAE